MFTGGTYPWLRSPKLVTIISCLQEEPIRGFHVGEHLEFMQQLESKFRHMVLPDMRKIGNP